MSLHVDVWSDFVCPWCYLVSTSLEKLQESHGVTVVWKSYELRPKSSPPIPEHYKQQIMAGRPQLIAMAKERYGLEMNQGQWGIDSRPALIGDKFAEKSGLGAEYHKAIFEAYFLEAKNIEDREVLGVIAEAVGLVKEDFLASLDDSDLEAEVLADIQLARNYELSGVPALVFENKYLIPGAQPYEELVRFVEQMEERLQKQNQ